MSKIYKEEITTPAGDDIEVQVTESHPQYAIDIDAPQCHWHDDFEFDPKQRAPGDKEIFAHSLLRIARRWAFGKCR